MKKNEEDEEDLENFFSSRSFRLFFLGKNTAHQISGVAGASLCPCKDY